MSLRFVTKTIHSYLDYPVAIALIALPTILNLGQSHELAFWLATVTGVAALILTIFTDHGTGLIRILPYKLHLAVDFIVALVFIAAPFILGFTGLDAAFYWINGAAVFVVVGLQQPETESSFV